MTRAKHCAENERIKRRYLQWLKDAKGYSTASIDMAAAAIARFEDYSRHRDFRRFHVEQARAFKAHFAGKVMGLQSGEPLSRATVASTLRQLKAFFTWLADQAGYRSSVRYADAAYFTPAGQDERIASGPRFKPVPELEDIEKALLAMPDDTEIAKRDRALFAFIFLTGARDRAVASLKLKHVDIAAGKVFQDAREVKTKRAKTFATQFFPVGDLPSAVLREWVGFLKTVKGFGPDDPLFPATEVELHGMLRSATVGLSRRQWQTTTPIRKIFKTAFARVGLPYFNPHSFRSTLARLGERLCGPGKEWKAWSQNLGHTDMMTTFSSYGQVPEHQQCEIIANIGQRKKGPDDLESVIASAIRRSGIKSA
jgi:integrase